MIYLLLGFSLYINVGLIIYLVVMNGSRYALDDAFYNVVCWPAAVFEAMFGED